MGRQDDYPMSRLEELRLQRELKEVLRGMSPDLHLLNRD